MKRKRFKISTRSVRQALGVHATSIGALLLFTATATPARAEDAVWDTVPSTNDWDDYFNWSGDVTPENPGDTATFNTSDVTSLALSANVTIDSITFNPGADAFTITTGTNTLFLVGAGIVNNSGAIQTIINGFGETGTISFAPPSGFSTHFTNNASAGNASIVNQGGGNVLFFETSFFDTSTAENATISNEGGADNNTLGGRTLFFDTSSAGNATITNNAGAFTDAFGGFTSFLNSSNAGNATITNNGAVLPGASGGGTFFFNASSAGSATITNNAGALMGATSFLNASNAGSAMLTNNGGAARGVFGGVTIFSDTSNAGSATITNNAGSATDAFGGATSFFSASNAGNATISNTGGTVSGAFGGATFFFDTSIAGSATIVSNGGTGGGFGGATVFFGSSDGGTARAITNGNGVFDISGLATGGMGIGSIEGSGNYFLGSKILSVGGNNLSTSVSGVIQDGGLGGGAGGSLTKVGTGTLTLTGANTYSGGTSLNGGILAVNSDLNLGTGPLSFNGGTLEALGAGGGITSLKAVNLAAGGGTFLADAGTASTLSGAMTGVGAWTKTGPGTLTLTGVNTYGGGTNLNGGILAVNSDVNLGTGALSFNGGTLQALVAGGGIDSSKAVNLAVGGGTFLADAGTASTLSGAITGVGAWTKAGPGTLTLTGANTYSGGTTVSAGTLQLGAGGTTGSITGNVANNGILAFNRSDVFTFNGLISGTGGVQQNGIGTTVLVADNTYTGGTTINGGALQLGNGGTTGSIVGNVIDNGALIFNRSDAVSFGGVISGTGSVQQNGTGTTVLVADNTYTGGTTINGGALQLGNGGTTGSIVGNVIDNGALIFNRSDAVSFGGVISGTGDLVKLGAGTLTLPGTNTYTGTTTVNGGSLIVDGSIASANTLVNLGGLLGGSGVIGGNLVNSGVVSPGSSPGTLTVNGDYLQDAEYLDGSLKLKSGTLRIEVAGASPGQFDVLAVNGHASVAGTLQLVRVGDFNLSVGDQITFLTASSGVSGTFGNVENDFLVTDSIVVFDIVYLPNGIVLEGTQGSFAEFALAFCGTPNSVAVGQALDSAVGDPRASELIGFLNNQPLTNLCDDIDLISPEQLTSIFVIGVSLANVQTANLERRMDDIHQGSTGFSSSGFAISGSGPSFSEGFAGVSGPEGKSGPPVFAPIPQNRWGVFVTGIGEFTDVDSTFNASGYDLATGGFTMGIDYRIGSHFAIGLTGGYAYTGANLVNDSSLQVNGGKLGLYATAFGSGFYLDTAVIGGLNGYDSRRTALEGTASGDTLGGDLNVLVAGGYDWKKGGLSIGPTASFQYTYVGIDDFTESGSLAPLAFPDQHAESFRTAFGMKASYDWKIGPIVLIPEVRLAWQHEFGDTDYSLVSSFANGAGNSFTVNGPEIGRDSMLLGAGFAIRWNDRISTYAYYDGELFRTNYLSNNVSAGFRVTF